MESEWSPESDETVPAPVEVGSPSPWIDGPTEQVTQVETAPVDTAPVDALAVDGVAAIDDGAEGVEQDVPADEESLHRSQVDAVDALLDEVELALTRLDDGTYGRCETCGAPIDDGRLADLPIARSCGSCDGSTATGGPDARDGDAAPSVPGAGTPAWV